jgi:hypothetical protein
MIKYALLCPHDHPFEGWFSTSSDFEDQQAKAMISCPFCASPDVRKAIVAPAVSGTKAQGGTGVEPTPEMRGMMMQAMGQLRQHVETNFDYMGDQFAAEARAIHEGETENRGIYGEATPKQVRELAQDGITVAPLPPKPPEKRDLN